MLFAIKSNFKFPTLAMPNEVDRVMKRLVTNDVTSGMSQILMFLLCLLDDCITSPASFCLFFCRGKLLTTTEVKQQLPELKGFCVS